MTRQHEENERAAVTLDRADVLEAFALCGERTLWPSCRKRTWGDRSTVYLASRGDRIKIGLSRCPGLRSMQLKARLRVILVDCGIEHESALHSLLAAEHRRKEWFRGDRVTRLLLCFESVGKLRAA